MTKGSTRLLYNKPAKNWNEAIPIGNGKLGGMIFGGIGKEIISLNHDELWTGPRKNKDSNEHRHLSFKKARQLALNDDLVGANEILEEEFLSSESQAYMPLGDMVLKFNHCNRFANGYKRCLDLKNAVCSVEYNYKNTKFTRKCFASHPSNVIAVELSAKGEKKLEFNLTFESQLKSTITTDGNNTIYLAGECPSEIKSGKKGLQNFYYNENEHRGIQFYSAATVYTDGEIVSKSKSIDIHNADKAIIYFSAETSFNGYNNHPYLEGKEYKNSCLKRLEGFNRSSFKPLLSEHVADYKDFFDRVTLDLGDSNHEDSTTDYRLKNYNKQNDDIELPVLLYNFGRYLSIASSRHNSQPSNLQGIWNNNITPPWRSNYTTNINTQMNYWPTLMCSMPELHLPLVKMIEELSVAGEKTAKDYYDAPGFVCHHNTDIWRFTEPVFGNACYGFWPFSTGWFCRHLFEHFEYSQDIDFLKNTAYPIMKKAAQFYNELLVTDKDDYYIFAPATSPENLFIKDNKVISVSQTATMSMSIIKELFLNTINSANILEIDDNFINEIERKCKKLLPFKVGSKGQLLEWYEEMQENEVHHRHVSHLYALYPSNLIDVESTPELARACKKSLKIRGDNGTGWSLGWKINLWAKLRDGDHALSLLEKQLRFMPGDPRKSLSGGGTYANLFDAHPPFQIDGNFGAVSGISLMLMQSEENKIYLLPALPLKWKTGSIKGLTAKGNIKVDISWRDGKLFDFKLRDAKKDTVVIYNGEVLKWNKTD